MQMELNETGCLLKRCFARDFASCPSVMQKILTLIMSNVRQVQMSTAFNRPESFSTDFKAHNKCFLLIQYSTEISKIGTNNTIANTILKVKRSKWQMSDER